MVKLHLGCGWRDFGKDWIHVDGGDYPHVKLKNITKLEFNSDTVDIIYSSHTIEYFDRDEIIDILLEWKRVLKPGGILRLSVPNFEKLIEVYQITNNLDNILGPLFGKMLMSNDKIYHKTVYDINSLEKLLDSVGFCCFEAYDWRNTEHSMFDDHSQAYFPHMDKENGLLISLNIQVKK